MKIHLTAVTCFLFTHLLGEAPRTIDVESVGYNRTFHRLKGNLKWQLGGRQIEILPYEDVTDFRVADGELIYQINSSRYLDGFVASENRKHFLILIGKRTKDYRDHHSLVRLSVGANDKVSSKELMHGNIKGLNDARRHIAELGAVSDCGSFAILRMSRPLDPGPVEESRLVYDWELWDIRKPMMIRRGLRISDLTKGEQVEDSNRDEAPSE